VPFPVGNALCGVPDVGWPSKADQHNGLRRPSYNGTARRPSPTEHVLPQLAESQSLCWLILKEIELPNCQRSNANVSFAASYYARGNRLVHRRSQNFSRTSLWSDSRSILQYAQTNPRVHADEPQDSPRHRRVCQSTRNRPPVNRPIEEQSGILIESFANHRKERKSQRNCAVGD